MAIRILDADTIGKISAGEVVERPSSVVKELLENSIDAGATSVTVEIRDGGISYLRVTDNGCGIPFAEARVAFENHATSKLKNADGLWDIRTLGFRGEALPSIASVSKVTMTTRTRNADFGAKVEIEGGRFLGVSETGCPEGTTIVMGDLFFNLPVRRVFLKKPSYEQGLVADVVSKMILGNPGVSIRFISNGKTVFRSIGDGDLRHAALAVYGRETAGALREINASEGAFSLKGLIGVGDQARPTRAQQCFFINGRLIRCPLLSQALEEACRGRVTVGMSPMCALSVSAPPEAVDINVHPSKLEVRFRDEGAFRLTAQSLLAKAFDGEKMTDALEPIKPAETAKTVIEEKIAPQPENPSEKKEAVWLSENTASFVREGGFVPPSLYNPIRIETVKKSADESDVSSRAALSENAKEETVLPDQAPVSEPLKIKEDTRSHKEEKAEQTVISPEVVPAKEREYRLIGILMNTYILLECNDSMIMVDQHAAHERLNFENYKKRLDEGNAAQQLLVPYILHLTRHEAQTLIDSRELLMESGYEIDAFGATDIQVRSVPFVMGQADMRLLFTELIESLDTLKSAEKEKRLVGIMQASCKHAVKAGDRLTDSEIRALLSEMFASDAPPTCPHGRPVLRVMTRREIERMFKRIQ